MIISPEYGPQIDVRDGTCGETKLELRWVLCDGRGHIWTSRQGRYTRETREEVETWIEQIKAANPKELYAVGLNARPCWCWPGHFDPAHYAHRFGAYYTATTPENVDDRVDDWHENAACCVDGRALHEHLGWTEEQYARWVEDPKKFPHVEQYPEMEAIVEDALKP